MAIAHTTDLQAGLEQVKALEDDAPYRSWPHELQRLWLELNTPRITHELKFLHAHGLAICLACLALDAQTSAFPFGVALRLGVVLPIYIIGFWLLGSKHRLLRLVGAIGPTVAFAGAVSLIGVEAGGDFYERYLLAACLVLTVSIVLFPPRLGPTCWLAGAGFVAIAAPLAFADIASIRTFNLLFFILLGSIFPLLIKRRSDRQRDENFILSLKSRQAQIELLAANKELEDLSQLDPLTGLLNRRGFEKRFVAAFEAAAASGEPLAVLLIDVDHFKAFNDTYGHQIGDECLAKIGGLLKAAIDRKKGFSGRYGGEEFIATLMGCESANAIGISERLREEIAGMELLDGSGDKIKVTASFGARIGRPADLHRANFVRDADQALYVAKDGGRNRVVLYSDSSGLKKKSMEEGVSQSTRCDSRVKQVRSRTA
ncbi:GGDEF domain-containing protein [Aurantiacibacter flavus]|uniref:diguanylate cyclase n=1 Tax=Aurantiacibacter flavus TaxID=3145232 RepID=A0ABV0CVV4_9SPHN